MSRSLFAMLSGAFEPEQIRLTRREMLRASAAAAAGSLLGVAGLTRAAERAPGGDGVIILGAGLSGLACALTLSEAGYSPLLLEPRLRAGGRVLSLSDMVPGKIVEGGGEFIGANHPTWQALAKRFDLPLVEDKSDETLTFPMLINGEVLDKKAAEALYAEMDAAFKTLTEQARAVNASDPWTTPDAAALDARSVADWWNGVTASDRARRAIRAQLENDNGVALERMSLLAMLAMIKGGGLEAYWTDSETFRCKGGNQKLATAMGGSLHGNRVLYNEPAVTVRFNGPTAVVTSKGGRAVNASMVVLALPPSLWSTIEFDVPLPTQTVQMGAAVKLLSGVKEPYWLKAGRAAEALGDQAPGLTWDATNGQTGDGACLTAFAGGPGAQRGVDEWSTKREHLWRDEIEKLQPGYGANLAGAPRFLGWPLERWTGAGYSFPAPGQVTTLVKAMRDNFGIARLRICGEHTSSAFPGYMEGALESGVREARRIVQAEPAAVPAGAGSAR
jgi:monoamine oxidase